MIKNALTDYHDNHLVVTITPMCISHGNNYEPRELEMVTSSYKKFEVFNWVIEVSKSNKFKSWYPYSLTNLSRMSRHTVHVSKLTIVVFLINKFVAALISSYHSADREATSADQEATSADR